jgi:hypothetical protein
MQRSDNHLTTTVFGTVLFDTEEHVLYLVCFVLHITFFYTKINLFLFILD